MEGSVELLDRLGAAVDGLASLDWATCPDGTLLNASPPLHRRLQMLQAVWLGPTPNSMSGRALRNDFGQFAKQTLFA